MQISSNNSYGYVSRFILTVNRNNTYSKRIEFYFALTFAGLIAIFHIDIVNLIIWYKSSRLHAKRTNIGKYYISIKNVFPCIEFPVPRLTSNSRNLIYLYCNSIMPSIKQQTLTSSVT